MIDSLAQAIAQDHEPLTVHCPSIRARLRESFSDPASPAYVSATNFLAFDHHALAVIELLGDFARTNGFDSCRRIVPNSYAVRCLFRSSRDRSSVADAVGAGPVHLYLFNDRNVHFEPLVRVRER